LSDEEVKEKGRFSQVITSIKAFASWSEVLRILGASSVVASMSIFLLQGWYVENDIDRYIKLLAQTGLLALGGFLFGSLLKENKGARMFFGLALISVPANFTVLGALVWSLISMDSPVASYPLQLIWGLPSIGGLGLVFTGALVVILPVTLLGFSIMARGYTTRLCWSFLSINSLILLPFRSSLIAVSLALVALTAAWIFSQRIFATSKVSKTSGEKFSVALLYIPAVLISVRSLYLYPIDELAMMLLGCAGYLACRLKSQSAQLKGVLNSVVEVAGLLFACLAMNSLVEFRAQQLSFQWELILYAALTLVFLFDFNRWSVTQKTRLWSVMV
jgi:hypothetical protein